MSVLEKLGACGESIRWVGDRPLTEELWCSCERGDWMLWLCARVDIDRRLLVRAAVACARPAVEQYCCTDPRPAEALRVALAWCEGVATIEDVRRAVDATDAAAYAAYAADAAAYAAYATADNADAAAYAATYAADAAAYAAYATADNADAAYVARATSLAHSAEIVRATIPWAEVERALEGVR